jgi:hypothetical protein
LPTSFIDSTVSPVSRILSSTSSFIFSEVVPSTFNNILSSKEETILVQKSITDQGLGNISKAGFNKSEIKFILVDIIYPF